MRAFGLVLFGLLGTAVPALRGGRPRRRTWRRTRLAEAWSDLEDQYVLPTDKPFFKTWPPDQWSALGQGPLSDGYQTYSGRVAAIAGDPANANILFVASAGSRLWETTNAGVGAGRR